MQKDYLGHQLLGETAEERAERVRKSKEREASFLKTNNKPDILKKRMDSDLFKGGSNYGRE